MAELIDRPIPVIDGLIGDPTRTVEPDALFDGWSRIATRDPDAAAALSGAGRCTQARRRHGECYARAVAIGLAVARESAGALEFFDKVHAGDFDERTLKRNAGRRCGRETGPRRLDDRCDALELSRPTRWRYRSAAWPKRGDADVTQPYSAVATTDNWYAMLASARSASLRADAAADRRTRTTSPGSRTCRPWCARELYACNLEPEATVEWRTACDT
jgi:hypothetical protein